MRLYTSAITLNGVELGYENPLPQFCDPVQNRHLSHDGTFLPEEELLFGYQTGKRILPYAAQDRYARLQSPQMIKTIVLENKNLKAVFLPEYGARLYSLYDKQNDRELLYKNEMFQFGNLSQRNAWFSGGIEFNFGHYGHSALTCSPMFAAKVCGDGHTFLRFYEFERTTSGFYQMDFHLPDTSDTLDMFVRLQAPEGPVVPTYWWTNTAVRQTAHCRVFSGTDKVLLQLPHPPGTSDTVPCFSSERMPKVKTIDGDCSYPAQIDYSCEYYFQNVKDSELWEAVGDEDGWLFFETSTQPLRYRKMYCWGNHAGGRRWQEFLNAPAGAEYLELQAGIAPTQLHGALLQAGQAIEFTQSFGVCALPEGCLEAEWHEAAVVVGKAVGERLSHESLRERHERYRELAELEILELYNIGSGWGALECARLKQNGVRLPQGIPFPLASISRDQLPWLELLQNKILPKHKQTAVWMTGKPWLKLLVDSLGLPGGKHWESLLHVGVMYMEELEIDKARKAWEESIEMKPTSVAWRNLSRFYLRNRDAERALSCMKCAISTDEPLDVAYHEEYLSLLILDGQYQNAWEHFCTLDSEIRSDRCEIIVCEAALWLEEDEFLEDFFAKEHAVIREGEYALTEVWYIWQSRLQGQNEAYMRRTAQVPQKIDFRMFVENQPN